MRSPKLISKARMVKSASNRKIEEVKLYNEINERRSAVLVDFGVARRLLMNVVNDREFQMLRSDYNRTMNSVLWYQQLKPNLKLAPLPTIREVYLNLKYGFHLDDELRDSLLQQTLENWRSISLRHLRQFFDLLIQKSNRLLKEISSNEMQRITNLFQAYASSVNNTMRVALSRVDSIDLDIKDGRRLLDRFDFWSDRFLGFELMNGKRLCGMTSVIETMARSAAELDLMCLSYTDQMEHLLSACIRALHSTI